MTGQERRAFEAMSDALHAVLDFNTDLVTIGGDHAASDFTAVKAQVRAALALAWKVEP